VVTQGHQATAIINDKQVTTFIGQPPQGGGCVGVSGGSAENAARLRHSMHYSTITGNCIPELELLTEPLRAVEAPLLGRFWKHASQSETRRTLGKAIPVGSCLDSTQRPIRLVAAAKNSSKVILSLTLIPFWSRVSYCTKERSHGALSPAKRELCPARQHEAQRNLASFILVGSDLC
jgi:hypothetical protein